MHVSSCVMFNSSHVLLEHFPRHCCNAKNGLRHVSSIIEGKEAISIEVSTATSDRVNACQAELKSFSGNVHGITQRLWREDSIRWISGQQRQRFAASVACTVQPAEVHG